MSTEDSYMIPSRRLSWGIGSCFGRWSGWELNKRCDVVDESRSSGDRLLDALARQDTAGLDFVIGDNLEHVGLTEEDRELPLDGGIVLGEPTELTAYAAVGFSNLAAAILRSKINACAV